MNDYKLILYPTERTLVPDAAALVAELERIELIGRHFTFRGGEHFLPGEEFMHLITFLGCSPHIEIEPPADGAERGESDFCHLDLLGPFPEPRFLAEEGVKSPRCPACRKPLEAWRAMLAAWGAHGDGYRHPCPACGAEQPPHTYKWRHSAAFARFALEVWGVFEGEAVPGEGLLTALRRATGCEWDYFYTSAPKPMMKRPR